MMTLQHLFTLILLLAFPVAHAEAPPPSLATFLIPNLVLEKADHTYTGHFYSLAKRILKDAHLDFPIIVLPPKRVIDMFEHEKTIIGFFPATVEMTKTPVYSTRYFAQKKDYIFYRKGSRYQKITDLYGKTVGLTRGYPYKNDLINNPKIIWSYNVSDEANFKKLAEGRLDYFLCEEVTANRALQLSGVKNEIERSRSPLTIQEGSFFFQHTPLGKKLATTFSTHLDRLIRKGVWDPVLQEYKEK